jgi:hypothetical protein
MSQSVLADMERLRAIFNPPTVKQRVAKEGREADKRIFDIELEVRMLNTEEAKIIEFIKKNGANKLKLAEVRTKSMRLAGLRATRDKYLKDMNDEKTTVERLNTTMTNVSKHFAVVRTAKMEKGLRAKISVNKIAQAGRDFTESDSRAEDAEAVVSGALNGDQDEDTIKKTAEDELEEILREATEQAMGQIPPPPDGPVKVAVVPIPTSTATPTATATSPSAVVLDVVDAKAQSQTVLVKRASASKTQQRRQTDATVTPPSTARSLPTARPARRPSPRPQARVSPQAEQKAVAGMDSDDEAIPSLQPIRSAPKPQPTLSGKAEEARMKRELDEMSATFAHLMKPKALKKANVPDNEEEDGDAVE